MPALADFEPLRTETVDTIRARIDANVNAGLDAADVRWQDTVPGGWFYDHTQAFALELEGVYDYVSLELPASFFLPFSFGIYLDYWGDMLDVPRGEPVAATGRVTLVNEGTEVVNAAAGTEVAVPSTDPSVDPLVFVTAESVVLQPTGQAGSSADVAIVAEDPGAAWNVAAHAIAQVVSPLSGVAVDNETAVTGGADEELDEPYKARLLLEFTGARGGGTIDDYIAETLREFPAVGNVVVQAAFAGPNTVRLIISDHEGKPLDAGVIAAVEAYWAANGPLDATVTVATVTATTVAVGADLELLPGYTLDGTAGTTPVRPLLDAALGEYFASLAAGADVLHNRVLSTLLNASEGVYNVAGLTLNDGSGPVAGDVAIADLASAQLAGPGTYTETVATP